MSDGDEALRRGMRHARKLTPRHGPRHAESVKFRPGPINMKMNCPYCGGGVTLRDSAVVYRRSYGPMWICDRYPACDAYVGCHKGTEKPLGRLANKELRDAKMAAHSAFDPMWKTPSISRTPKQMRSIAYRWLAEQLGLDAKKCHIGLFDAETCRRVVEACEKYKEALCETRS